MLVALLAVLGLAVWGGIALAKPGADTTPPTVSSINRAGTSPTNATTVSWTVTFSESVTGVSTSNFLLAVSGTTTAGSPVVSGASGSSSYTVSSTLTGGDGAVVLQLKAAGASAITDPTGNALGTASLPFNGQPFTIDRTVPPVPSVLTGPSKTVPVPSTSASFTFGDSESGVSFLCKLDTGSFAACSSAQSYSGLVQGAHSLQVEARDAAGNTSAPSVSYLWTVDTVAPPAPLFAATPADPGPAIFTFTWQQPAGSEPVTDQCQLENGSWGTCLSPDTVTVNGSDSNQQHQFSVRAVDQAGNVSSAISFKWKVDGGGKAFTINGSVGGLVPGVAAAVAVTINNPNNQTIYVSQITFSVQAGSGSGACPATGYQVTPWNASPPSVPELTVPANAMNFAVPVADRPAIKLVDSLTLNQDNCKGKSFTLVFSGSAHS